MTLTVSLRIPDGIVMAADSLSTLQAVRQNRGNLSAKCPECGEAITLKDVPIPQLPQTASFSPSAQKMFNLWDRFGLSAFGAVFLGGRSLDRYVREFTKSQKPRDENKITVKETAEKLAAYFENIVKQNVKNLEKVQANRPIVGFQLAGFDEGEDNARTYIIEIGKETKVASVHDQGPCTVQGDTKVVRKLWNKKDGVATPETVYQSFTLQDGVDYARFLIRTTAYFQRFAAVVPTVGGPVDIAVILPDSGFHWLKRKKIYAYLDN